MQLFTGIGAFVPGCQREGGLGGGMSTGIARGHGAGKGRGKLKCQQKENLNVFKY